jgi:glutamate-1-semialdehyde 2,1-aminomutase
MGGGFPVGASGGEAEVIEVFDPGSSGPWFLAGGTLSANRVTMAPGLAAMLAMTEAEFARLESLEPASGREALRATGVGGR